PETPPANISAELDQRSVVVQWAEPADRLNGHLLGYKVEYSAPNVAPAVLDVGLSTGISLNLSSPLSNVSLRVCAYTAMGPGPWSPLRTLTVTRTDHVPPATFSWHWWYVVMATAVAVALVVLIAMYVARLRRKETRFGEAFQPMEDGGELVVRYRARRSYGRRTTEATLEVHQPNRYVLCPQHETQRLLGDSLESLNLIGSASTATLPLSALSPAHLSEGLEGREEAPRKGPWH
ncbi:hypothetical protein Z043_116755, partial [Scleropages formosus]